MRHGSRPCDLIGNARLPENPVGPSRLTANDGGESIGRCSIARAAPSRSRSEAQVEKAKPVTLLKHPSAFLPVAMSFIALVTVVVFVSLHGTAPQPDEGTAARIWQLLMAAQIPFMVFFAVKWVPQSPGRALPILALQIAAALAAMAPVFFFHW
jgi:hypothetical protein